MTNQDPHAIDSGRLTVIDPCCRAESIIDAATGTVIWHHPEPTPRRLRHDLALPGPIFQNDCGTHRIHPTILSRPAQ